jgi:hypothetical protein
MFSVGNEWTTNWTAIPTLNGAGTVVKGHEGHEGLPMTNKSAQRGGPAMRPTRGPWAQVWRKASRSALTLSLWVEHRPWGAPG